MNRSVWISWAPPHRRTQELAGALGMPLYQTYRKTRWFVRYPDAALRTMALLIRRRPSFVFVQCPSILLGVFAILLSWPLRFRVIADHHNDTIQPFRYTGAWYRWACQFVVRRAAINIVTNDALAAIVRSLGGRVAVLPDKLPRFAGYRRRDLGPGQHVVFICSFAPDEPYVEVIEAARLLPEGTTVHVTGRHQNAVLPPLPSSVQLTGYLPEADYVDLLYSADVVLDLTLMENCLVCGGYEAVALHKPLVTSATSALRAYFGNAAVYCGGDRTSIADGLRDALSRTDEIRSASTGTEPRLRTDWDRQKEELVALVNSFSSVSTVR